jgi:hypothetical protein
LENPNADFSLEAFEREMLRCGFEIVQKRKFSGFGTYAARLPQKPDERSLGKNVRPTSGRLWRCLTNA